MRLAVLIHPFGRFGGAERLAIIHAIGLTEVGVDVTMYTDTRLMHREWLSLLASKVPVRNLPYGLRGGEVIRDLAVFDRILIHHHIEPLIAKRVVGKYADKTYWYSGEVLRAVWEDKITGKDYRQFSPTVFRTASHFYGKRSWIAFRGPIYNVTVSMLRVLDMATVRRFKGVIANSEYMANLVRKIYRYPGPMFVVYPAPSLPASMFKPDYGNGDYILAVGALLPNKNHHDLLEAMSLLKEPPTLRIVGDGQEGSNLKDQAQELGVETEFVPLVTGEELCRLYEGSLFVVVPSLSEPFGMTAVEAALAGKPSVVTELGGTKEFVLDQETGLVVNPRKAKSFASAMEMLLYDRDLRRNMGQRARERALEAFTPEQSTFALGRALGH
jgi:glycosyltransferase involved in cell wall biosynthesis